MVSSSSEGAMENVSATIPKAILEAVRARIGRGEFSAFVSRSLQHELVREDREQFIAEAIAAHGPLDRAQVARARRLLRS
jgi:Arc/MetJ-type ribon-helix-helix transcriptional regulator